MEAEFNLSEKIWYPYENDDVTECLFIPEVKEFIRILKENSARIGCNSGCLQAFLYEIDRLAGDRLNGS